MENNKDISFYDFGLDPSVLDGLDAMNFKKPSPIQAESIPHILKGENVIACAQTGTGKTAAFLLPILSELATGEYPEEYVNVIIMAPTRELAQQIDQQVDAFSYFVGVSAVPIYGGTGGIEWEQQRRALQMGADLIIATPGRLLSHIGLDTVDLSRVSFFVLDEADRMLDMGFHDDILEVYKLLPPDVQTIMYSATMPNKIRTFAKQIAKNAVEINIAISRPPESIDQSVYFCNDNEKLGLLIEIFKERKPKKCIVFFGSKDAVKQARKLLTTNNFKVSEMHSDLEQDEREEVMRNFKAGNIDIIVATDIISRGIDVTDINLIINYDVPSDPEDYVHRIGRTARGTNEAGAAITIVNHRDKARFISIEDFLGYTITRNTLPKGFAQQRSGNPKGRTQRGRGNKGGKGGAGRPHDRSSRNNHKGRSGSKERSSKANTFSEQKGITGQQDRPAKRSKKNWRKKKNNNQESNKS